MAWLLRDEEVLASLDIAGSRRERRQGLRGRLSVERPLLIAPCRSIHTMGMRVAIDMVAIDANCRIVAVRRVPPWRVVPPVRGAVMVIETADGDAARWGLDVGVEVKLAGCDVERTRFGVRVS